MALLFDLHKNYCHRYVGRPPVKSNFRPVLLPFLGWKVQASKLERGGLNIFQTTILKLAGAGCYDHARVVQLLRIDIKLVEYIVKQLESEQLIDSFGHLTSTGQQEIDRSRITESDKSIYYIFQDPWNKTLIPKVVPADEFCKYIEPTGWKNRCPEFAVSQGGSWVDRPFVIPVGNVDIAQPDIDDVVDATRKFNVSLHNQEVREMWDDDDFVDYEYTELELSNVNIFSDEPTPIYIWSWLYIDLAANVPWVISDPFRETGTAGYIEEYFRQCLKRCKPLASQVDKMLGKPTHDDKKITLEEHRKRITEQAKLKILTDFSWTTKFEIVERELGALLRKKIELEKADVSSSQQEDVDSLINIMQKVIEALFRELLVLFPLENKWKLLRNNGPRWQQKEFNKRFFLNLQMREITESVATQFSHQPPNSMPYAQENSSLKILLVCNVLASQGNNLHPFHSISNTISNWLEQTLDVANCRNRASHANEQTNELGNILKLSDFTIELIHEIGKRL